MKVALSRFSEVVSRTVENWSQLEERVCPDQFVGTLADLRSHGSISFRGPPSIGRGSDRVLLILESPHTSEFKAEPGPAKGRTGLLLAKYVLSVPGLAERASAPLILVNAIQYQCSLGEKTHRYRDKVFAAVWREFGKTDFTSRLAAIHMKDDVVVCACTKGKGKDGNAPLRRLVYDAIIECLPPQAHVLRRTHPSSWFSSVNRNYEWDI